MNAFKTAWAMVATVGLAAGTLWAVEAPTAQSGVANKAGASSPAAATSQKATESLRRDAAAPAQGKEEAMPTIAKYLGNRNGAVSLTFDDGFRKEVEDATGILDPLGLKGTFFLIPLKMEDPKTAGSVITWEQARKLLADGHELGTHGNISEKLHEISDERLDFLVNESWRLIKERAGAAPVSYALPGGSNATDRVVEKIREHHYFIRKPELLPKVSVMGYGNAGKRKWSDEQTRKSILACRDTGGWLVAVIHSIVGGYSPFNSKEEFRSHCQWLKSQDETIWTAPMGVVGRYVRAREAAKLIVVERKPGTIRFKVSCDLKPPELSRVPLTIVIPAAGATKASATRGEGGAPTATIKDGHLLVDILPDGVETTVTWTSAAK